MADFLSNLWSSIFTPGPTPTLLVATNVTFALLQVVLLGLLITTYSIHFLILSVLCGGLWYSINWFAMELAAAQAKEEQAERLRKQKKQQGKGRSEAGDTADDEGEDTEVEDGRGMRESVSSLGGAASHIELDNSGSMQLSGETGRTDGAIASGLRQHGDNGLQARHRRAESDDRSGEISTDSEWEKVSQEGDRQ